MRAIPDGPSGEPRFMGSTGCSSSLCHGGASVERNSYTIWKKLDHHSRAFGTLATERSARIAQALQLGAPAQTTRCTECHAPMQSVPENHLLSSVKPDEGISCENCHGPSQNWIRSHTRRDFTHAQDVQTGMRDLKDLYVRANSCVACHQVLPPDVLAAGHPPLIFELDAQTVAEPRHWVDQGDYYGPKAWLVGQAAALRETSWSIGDTADPAAEVREQWRALVWLVQKATDALGGDLPKFDVPNATDFSPGNVARAKALADDIAHAAARTDWSRGSTRRCLDAFAGSQKDFVLTSGSGESASSLQHRAQRLVLALSRFIAPLQAESPQPWAAASQELDKLFALADARAAFDAGAFSDELHRFETALAAR